MNYSPAIGASQEPASFYDFPDRIEHNFITADGYRTHYIASGVATSKPVFLIHGGNFEYGMGVDRWYPTILPLAEKFRVIAPDELGGGETEAPRNLEDIGDLRVRADHILAFIEAMDVGPAHIVGQSQGSWIAAYVALKRPDLVDRIVLVDSASLAVPDGGMGNAGIDAGFTDSFLPGTMVKANLEATRESVLKAFSSMVYDPAKLSDAFLDRLVELAEKWLPIWHEPWRKFWADGGKRNREQYLVDGIHLSESIDRLPSPPLVIWGRNSVKGFQNGVELYKRIPDAQLHVFDKANHFLWLDQPRDFNDLVGWYLSR